MTRQPLSTLRFFYNDDFIDSDERLCNVVTDGCSIVVFALCSTPVRLHELEMSVSDYSGHRVSHLMKQCFFAFSIQKGRSEELQLYRSSGELLQLANLIPFHGFSETLILRDSNPVLLDHEEPATITVTMTYEKENSRRKRITMATTSTVQELLESYLKVVAAFTVHE